MEATKKWYKQEEHDIFNEESDWNSTYYTCLMKDGTVRTFASFMDENMNGEINQHLYCIDNDEYDIDDILYWFKKN